jgi:hypothetical protein
MDSFEKAMRQYVQAWRMRIEAEKQMGEARKAVLDKHKGKRYIIGSAVVTITQSFEVVVHETDGSFQ